MEINTSTVIIVLKFFFLLKMGLRLESTPIEPLNDENYHKDSS